MKISILKSARSNIKSAAQFYESQKDGLGDYFVDSILSDIDSLVFFAGVHPIFFGKYFRMLARRFPYSIYYKVTNGGIFVHAVLDLRSDPKSIETWLM